MELRRYSRRHDAVLEVLGSFIKQFLPQQFTISIDSPTESYKFPQHITPTNLRPDMVWWCDQPTRELWLFELTISYESQVANARDRKRDKYHDLVVAGKAAGYSTRLITLEVGCRGMVDIADFAGLQEAVHAQERDYIALCQQQSGQSSWAPIPSGAQGITTLDYLIMYIHVYIVSPGKCMPQ